MNFKFTHWNYIKLISILSLAILPILATSLNVYSQDNPTIQSSNRGLVVIPATQDIDVDRGQQYLIEIELNNDDPDSSIDISTEFETFQASAVEGVPELRPFDDQESQRSWIQVQEDNFTLQPQEVKNVFVTLNIPQNANPGGYYYAVIFGTKTNVEAATNQVIINRRISSLLFVNVKGKINRTVEFESFSITKDGDIFKSLFQATLIDPYFDSLDVEYKIKVDSNSFFKPNGNVFLYQQDDKPDATIQINPEGKIILPNSTRTFGFKSDPELKTISPRSSGLDILRPIIGSQTVELRMSFINSDEETEVISAKSKIIYFPWKLILIILLSFGILTLALVLYRKFGPIISNKLSRKHHVQK